MITEVFIDLEKVFKGLSHIKQVECAGKFYFEKNYGKRTKHHTSNRV